jgi:quinol monooxygenase YgiN
VSVLEIARIRIRPGSGAGFADGSRSALRVLADSGALSCRAFQCHERADEFVFLIEWESVDAHLEFRQTPAFGEYRKWIQEYFEGPPEFAHYEMRVALPPTGSRSNPPAIG